MCKSVNSYPKHVLTKRWSIVAICIASISACSTPQTNPVTPVIDTPYELREDYTSGVIHYTVRQGDTLHKIASDYTGNGANWQALAAINKIANSDQLVPGTVVRIPSTLIPGYEDKRVARLNSQNAAPVLGIKTAEPMEVAPVLVTTAKPNRDFELQPVDPQSQRDTQTAAATSNENEYASAATHVVVVGSYVPQGIYGAPAPYSNLMMRASPGSKFVLVSQVNDWFKVETDKGIGYIRTTDAAVVK